MWNVDHFFEKIETTQGTDYMLRAREAVPEKGVYIRPHVHLEYEVMWFRRAEGFYSIGSEKFKLRDNTLVFVGPMILHDMELAFTDNHERFLLQYNNTVLNRLKYQFPVTPPHAGFVLQLNECDAERMHFLFRWFTDMHDLPNTLCEANPLLILLLNTVFTHAQHAEQVTVSDEKNNIFDKIIDLVVHVEKNTTFNMTLNEAAAHCSLSTSHFSRTFKRIMQVSFKEYLIGKKIAQSTELLRNTELSITDIAYQCEFTDSAYYCFKFRSLMGVTPKTFRINSRSTKQLSTKHDSLVRQEKP